VRTNIESEYPLTTALYQRLTADEIFAIEEGVARDFGNMVAESLRHLSVTNLAHYRREILRYGPTVTPDVIVAKLGMHSANPPPKVHSMIRQGVFSGDMYSGDMILSAIKRADLDFNPSSTYLDFGCSSGALTRNMAAYLPQATWYGCDPVKSSIEWATRHFPSIKFATTQQSPPLPYESSIFAGVYAVSIWSHFAEAAAVRWFSEMHRVIKPGGFLVFTTHGMRSLFYYLERDLCPPDVVRRLLSGLICNQHAFQTVWNEEHPDPDGLEVGEWGQAYFTIEWVLRRLTRQWILADYQPGLNQLNQDVYVLVRQ
jgi:SAM-dependent methyltransferase